MTAYNADELYKVLEYWQWKQYQAWLERRRQMLKLRHEFYKGKGK